MLKRWNSLLFIGVFFSSFFLNAQQNTELQLANLYQDFQDLKREFGRLQLDLERAEHERAVLQETLRRFNEVQQQERQASQEWRAQYQATTQKNIESANEQLLQVVNQSLEKLTVSMQKSLDTMSENQTLKAAIPSPAREKPKPAVQFSDNYPKEGVSYRVKTGDSLSKIAQKMGARVEDIRNANRIVNPNKDLKAGDTIFIPLKPADL